jgi:hypothetical protein
MDSGKGSCQSAIPSSDSMQSVTIYPVVRTDGAEAFRAVSSTSQTEGRTAGEALDAIAPSLPAQPSGTLVVIQPFHADEFFSAQQQARLGELMNRWRAARNAGKDLPPAEQDELARLVDAELRGAIERTSQLLAGMAE